MDHPTKLCNGIIADWATWQLENGEAFHQLQSVLAALSPSHTEKLQAGQLRKVSLGDARRHPTLHMPYGQDVPLIHASAGMRRVIALAYLLVWTWQEHQSASTLQGKETTREIIFLIDEIEAHLHPQWQRRIVPALLDVMHELTDAMQVPIQLITATHSPLVLASTEPRFDETEDAIWELDLEGGQVKLQPLPWQRHGDANAWLTSGAFDLQEARSLEAEEAVTAALALLRLDDPDPQKLNDADKRLRAALSDTDPFWMRWSAWRQATP